MAKSSGRRLRTMKRTRSPCVTSTVGPGIEPLKPHASTGRPGRNVVFTGSAVSVKTFTPFSTVKAAFGRSGVSTATGVEPGGGSSGARVHPPARSGAAAGGGITWPACGSWGGFGAPDCAAASDGAAAELAASPRRKLRRDRDMTHSC